MLAGDLTRLWPALLTLRSFALAPLAPLAAGRIANFRLCIVVMDAHELVIGDVCTGDVESDSINGTRTNDYLTYPIYIYIYIYI